MAAPVPLCGLFRLVLRGRSLEVWPLRPHDCHSNSRNVFGLLLCGRSGFIFHAQTCGENKESSVASTSTRSDCRTRLHPDSGPSPVASWLFAYASYVGIILWLVG